MSAGVGGRVVRPGRLSAEQRRDLFAELNALHSSVFDAEDEDSFRELVAERAADDTVLYLRRDEAGIAGYLALFRYDRVVHRRTTTVYRAVAGSRRSQRGSNSMLPLVLGRVLLFRLRHPVRPVYFLGLMLHPTSYLLVAKYAPQLWPEYRRSTPPPVLEVMRDLAASFGLAVSPHNPLAVHAGVSTRQTDEERLYWRTSDRPAARFFVQANPDYGKGYGLLTLVPVTMRTCAYALGRLVLDRAQRRGGPMLSTALRLPVLKQVVGRPVVRRALRQAPLFAGLSADEVSMLDRAGELHRLPAGRTLFRAGDDSDDLYLVVVGTVYVLADDAQGDRQERVVDQLSSGSLVGELGMLSGQTRSATIRTARPTTVLRLRRADLLALMDSNPHVREAVWQAYAWRRFADLAPASGSPFAGMTRQQLRSGFDRGAGGSLAAGEQSDVTQPWMFIVVGQVELDSSPTPVRGPALLQVAPGDRLTAVTSARYVYLPAPTRGLP